MNKIIAMLSSLALLSSLSPFCTSAVAQDGLLDSEFGAGTGVVIPDLAATPGQFSAQTALAVAIDGVGRLLVAGAVAHSNDSSLDCVVLRLLSDGSLDTSFAPPNGFRTLSVGLPTFPNELCTAILPLPDGRIALAGAVSGVGEYTGMVAVLQASGALDPSFSGNGVFVIATDTPIASGPDINTLIESLQVDAAGRLLALGDFVNDNSTSAAGLLLRFFPDSGLDTSFGNIVGAPGFVQLSSNASKTDPAGMARDAQGRLLVLASSGSQLVLFRLGDDGQLDSSFGTGMTAQGGNGLGYLPNCSFASDFLIDPQQRWLIACKISGASAAEDRAGVLRAFGNGEIDLDFGVSGYAAMPVPDANGSFSRPRLTRQDDGRLLLAGRYEVAAAFRPFYGNSDLYALRLNSNGSLDSTYGFSNGYSRFRFADPAGGLVDTRQERADAAVIDALGRLLVVGERFDNNGDNYRMVVTRLTRAPPPSDALFADGFE